MPNARSEVTFFIESSEEDYSLVIAGDRNERGNLKLSNMELEKNEAIR